ncbi:MAG: hypothetical protein GQ527_04935 [Bacteroidales bacterium]|nr:hypothetical protein [Bacteroidales bacterium]
MTKTHGILNFFERTNPFLVLIMLLFLFLQSCELENKIDLYDSIYCDVDTSKIDETGKKFIVSKNKLINQELNIGGFISDQESYSGNHSILLTGKKVFGLSTKFHQLKGNDHFLLSVWRKDPSGKAALVVQGDKTSSIYIARKEAVEVGENGWERLEIEIEIPPNVHYISCYTWKIGADSAFFDDLEIHELPPKEYPAFAKDSKLHLYFSDRKMEKFENKRFRAFEDGILISDGEWMKGIMSDELGVMPIKARLKGDWLDHLIGKKWSFRVKMRDDFTFNRMRVFSLQNPNTRYFLHEYVAHQLFDSQDVLTTRYGFIPLYVNGTSLGLYAWEEHFAKQLVEFNLRREGPILKFDEDPLWRVHQQLVLQKTWLTYPYFETSRVVAFGMGKTLEKPALAQQFNIAQSLMYQYKDRKAPINQIFNVDILAKYWALIDITNGRHGIAWHNQRVYYNPVLCKLEPINFDNYTDYYKEDKEAIITALLFKAQETVGPEHNLLYSVFHSSEFVALYIEYLEKYSDESFLKDFMDQQTDHVSKYESMIQEEFKKYSFSDQFLYTNAATIRAKLPELKERWKSGFYETYTLTDLDKIADTAYYPGMIPKYINANYYFFQANEAHLRLENNSGRTIEILGLADEDKKLIRLLNQPVYLKPFEIEVKDTTITTSYTDQASQLAFRVNGHEEILYAELSLWRRNYEKSPYQELLASSDIKRSGLFQEKGDSLIVKKGRYQLKEKILVASDKIVIFEAGAELDMINHAAFISHAPVFMMGNEKQPIRISSSDSTANSFTVLQAKEKSELKHVIFSHLNTLNYNGWTLTGAVNFYEADVLISHCTFENNHCEDALNIIRSDFLVEYSSFLHIYADAFDSDFCTGVLDESKFDYVDNDAIDFSTSQIEIQNCSITNIIDKGVSGGEGSTLMLRNTFISNCNIGVASKDLSIVDMVNVTIEDSYYGLVALQKKPEYGPATLLSKKLVLKNCNIKHLIEKGSKLELNGRKITGTQEKVADLFY